MREQTARRRYECGWGCGEPIEAGRRYVYASVPPGGEPTFPEQWEHLRLHGRSFYDCPSVTIQPPGQPAPQTVS